MLSALRSSVIKMQLEMFLNGMAKTFVALEPMELVSDSELICLVFAMLLNVQVPLLSSGH